MYLSLKESTREREVRVTRERGRVKLNSLSGNWIDFLCNVKELFTLLTSKISGFTFTVIQAVFVALIEAVVSIGNNNSAMQNYNHEEADIRLVTMSSMQTAYCMCWSGCQTNQRSTVR